MKELIGFETAMGEVYGVYRTEDGDVFEKIDPKELMQLVRRKEA